jgi:hypothetical protein
MTLRIALSIVPGGNENRQYTIGNIDICNIGENADRTCNYAAIMQKREPFGAAFCIAEDKGLVTYDERGVVIAIRDHDDADVKVAQVFHHDRLTRDAHDLLYRALVSLGYLERNSGTDRSR